LSSRTLTTRAGDVARKAVVSGVSKISMGDASPAAQAAAQDVLFKLVAAGACADVMVGRARD
jgi:hypothetical protein